MATRIETRVDPEERVRVVMSVDPWVDADTADSMAQSAAAAFARNLIGREVRALQRITTGRGLRGETEIFYAETD